jgi:shikimate kinase
MERAIAESTETVATALPEWRNRPIILVGLMGSGKSAIGKRLAAALGRPFRDSDSEIEAAARMTIAEIFERFGEAHFRDGERRLVQRLLGEGPAVIATGGGAFQDPETRAAALARGLVVWLDADLDTLVARVGRRTTRPLLKDRDARAVLAELAEQRRPAYAQAHLHVKTGDGPHDEAVRRILALLGCAP